MEEPRVSRDIVPERFVASLTMDGQTLHVRPLEPGDAPILRAFFYTHDSDTIRARYRYAKTGMSEEEAHFFCTLDYRQRFALGAFLTKGQATTLVAVARYEADAATRMVETDLVVAEKWRRRGLATRLWLLLVDRAKELGYIGVCASFAATNAGALALHRHLHLPLRAEDGECACRVRFEDWTPPPARSGPVGAETS